MCPGRPSGIFTAVPIFFCILIFDVRARPQRSSYNVLSNCYFSCGSACAHAHASRSMASAAWQGHVYMPCAHVKIDCPGGRAPMHAWCCAACHVYVKVDSASACAHVKIGSGRPGARPCMLGAVWPATCTLKDWPCKCWVAFLLFLLLFLMRSLYFSLSKKLKVTFVLS